MSTPRKAPTLASALARASIFPASAAVAGIAVLQLVGPTHVATTVPTPPAEVPAAVRMADRHGCWSGEAPARMEGRTPGHVVVTLPGQHRPTYGGPKLVAQALDQVFAGADHDLVVHAFCR